MSEQVYPPEGHDFIGAEQVLPIAEQNKKMITSQYYGQVGELKVIVWEKLSKIGALTDGTGWAIFNTDAHDPNVQLAEGQLLEGAITETVLFSYWKKDPRTGKRGRAPYIRIATNEPITSFADETWLGEDITIDDHNICMYMIDAASWSNEASDFVPSGSFAPIFIPKEGNLLWNKTITNGTGIVRVKVKDPKSGHPKFITPFGDGRMLEDKRYALDAAQRIVSQVVDASPVAICGRYEQM